MKNQMIYFDNAATTSISHEVLEAMLPYLKQNYGNASSVYFLGRESKKAIEEAREKVASAIKCQPREVYYTSSGTESDNWAIKGVAQMHKSKGRHIITSNIEHPAVLETCRSLEKEGYEVTYLPVNEEGIVSVESVKDAIREDTILVTIMMANNEIGTIQPISEIGKITREKGVIFHTDAVQAIGNLHVDVNELNVDLLSLTAHKFSGPKGVGALYIRKGGKISSLITGGHQERGRRASTENVAGIVGLGKAIELASKNLDAHANKLLELREKAYNGIRERIPYTRLNGHKENRLPGNLNVSFEFIEGEALLLMLDMKGIAASSGSACTSGSLDPSHVLLAIGLPHEIAHGSLRLSFGEDNTTEDVDYLLETLPGIVQRLRDMSPLYEKVKRGNV